MQQLLSLLALALPVLLATQARAVSLGDELILSRLGDPVEVEIEVRQWQDMDLQRVQIAAANQQEYAAFGLTWLPVLDNLDFNLVGPDLDGELRLLVSSRAPVSEPFLELLLVLRWPGGSLLREYVLLFDPPGLAVPVAAVAPASELLAVPGPAPEQAREIPVPAPLPESEIPATTPAAPAPIAETPATPEPAPDPELPDVRTQLAIDVETLDIPAPPAPAAVISTRRQYQVRSGDTLWNIARQFRPAGAGENLYQMLLSLHDLNRGAFINGNISLLKANASLQIPEAADVASVAAGTAETRFEQRWDEGTRRFDTALRGDPLPLFTTADGTATAAATDVPGPAADVPAISPSPPGQEQPQAVNAGQDLIMVSNAGETNAMRLALTGSDPAPAEPGFSATGLADSIIPEPARADQTTSPLDGIAESAEILQEAMRDRERRLQDLEQQVVAMRIRMQEAQTVAAMLNSSLTQALANRQMRENDVKGNSLLLGGMVLVLIAGLVVAVVLVLRQTGLLRSLRSPAGPKASTVENPPLPAAAARGRKRRAMRTKPVLPETPVPAAGMPVNERNDKFRDRSERPRKTGAESADLFDRMEHLLADEGSQGPGRT